MGLGSIDYALPDVTTTDATPTIASSLGLVEDSNSFLGVAVVARNPANGDSITWWKHVHVRRIGAGDAQVASLNLTAPIKTDALLLWDVDIADDAENILVVVTGASMTTVEWAIKSESIGIRPSS